jgi:nucleoside-diphosphate-sugar epimerase
LIREDLHSVVSSPTALRECLAGCDCVIHLAAISNDPSAELNPDLTEEVNFHATAALAEASRHAGVRFVFSSSCSVYGGAPDEVDEQAPVAPLTTYAISKVRAEEALLDLARPGWAPVILRNGTLFGYSPRMRFDLVVNIFSLYSALHNKIKVFGDGAQWRPFLHVADCARAFVHFAERPEAEHLCYNIARENLRVSDVAQVFKRINPALVVTHLGGMDADQRDYRVSTRRMRAEGFETRIGVEVGAEEIVEAIISGTIPDPESIFYRNAKWLRELAQIGSKTHRDILSLLETRMQADPTRGWNRPEPEG